MTPNILILLVLILAAVAFGWLTRRAWRSRNAWLKWAGAILGGLVTLIFTLVSVIGIIGFVKFYSPKSNPVPEVSVEGTPEQIERGKHITDAFCVGCHSSTSEHPMTGGVDMGGDLPMNLGSFASVNLTPAGPLSQWSDGEIFRALRDNVDNQGGRLVFMAGTNVRFLSDEDMRAVIAFLRSQEPVEKPTVTPADQPSFLGLLMFGAGVIADRPLVEGVISAPEMAPTVEYGAYMISYLDCSTCHGADLTGGTSPVSPHGPSLRVVKGWTLEQFMTTLRTGVDPSGHELKPTMPWKSSGRMDDTELTALYSYLLSLP
jgi:mono/diheme cytochrome c family protein